MEAFFDKHTLWFTLVLALAGAAYGVWGSIYYPIYDFGPFSRVFGVAFLFAFVGILFMGVVCRFLDWITEKFFCR